MDSKRPHIIPGMDKEDAKLRKRQIEAHISWVCADGTTGRVAHRIESGHHQDHMHSERHLLLVGLEPPLPQILSSPFL